MPQITQVWQENFCVYGADKIWRALNRMGTTVARCTVERLMKRLRLQGAKRGKKVRTTIPDELADRPSDLVKRQFKADRPNQLWVSDFTYVSTWQGVTNFILSCLSNSVFLLSSSEKLSSNGGFLQTPFCFRK